MVMSGIDTLTSQRRSDGVEPAMKPISYRRHRFPPDIIRHAVWLYFRFTLSFRDVEDLLAERGVIVSNESIRRWVFKFGPTIAKALSHLVRKGSLAACCRFAKPLNLLNAGRTNGQVMSSKNG
jgi:hypothetical protein